MTHLLIAFFGVLIGSAIERYKWTSNTLVAYTIEGKYKVLTDDQYCEYLVLKEAVAIALQDDLFTSNGEYHELFKYNHIHWFQDEIKEKLSELKRI